MPLTRAKFNSLLEQLKLPHAPKAQGDEVEMKMLLSPVCGEGTHSSIPHELPKKTENYTWNVTIDIYVF